MAKTYPQHPEQSIGTLSDSMLLLLWDGVSNKNMTFATFKEYILNGLPIGGARYRGSQDAVSTYEVEDLIVTAGDGANLWRCIVAIGPPAPGNPLVHPAYDPDHWVRVVPTTKDYSIVDLGSVESAEITLAWRSAWVRMIGIPATARTITVPDYVVDDPNYSFFPGFSFTIKNYGIIDLFFAIGGSATVITSEAGLVALPANKSATFVYINVDMGAGLWDVVYH